MKKGIYILGLKRFKGLTQIKAKLSKTMGKPLFRHGMKDGEIRFSNLYLLKNHLRFMLKISIPRSQPQELRFSSSGAQ